MGISLIFLRGHEIYNVFPHGEAIFKTIRITPDPEETNYPLCLVPGQKPIPVTISLSEATSEEIQKRPRYWPKDATAFSNATGNIEFIVINNSNRNVIIEKIDAVLLKYEPMPDRCFKTVGPMFALIPVELFLDLGPDKKVYDISRQKVFEIDKGESNHLFIVYVTCAKPGIYQFRLTLNCRIGGTKRVKIDSDQLYTFALPDNKKCKQIEVELSFFDIDSDKAFSKLKEIVNWPPGKFKNLTYEEIYKEIVGNDFKKIRERFKK